ncbi:hypothetical protein MON38_14115 [Hymenobacter sp. DH14]|uniref:Macroglobulin domain-containing protein n=1 Tax=Hymenobacter cyanobacteriorum TaxID=2926463 RepID=A0A9X1VLY4_9BACT|nr:MG2 domain-containing protein [Hymenobacter cyanobacteriorum]MCI1188561.1 hypothetical protein [Hymenobacter cyanobacteriorum]
MINRAKTGRNFLAAALLGLLAAGPAAGQADSLGSITRRLQQYAQRDPHEKLYLHLDRPLYLSGETMWFKVYAAEGAHARPLALSSVAYVEVLDAKNQPVLQGKVALKNATGHGYFTLPTSLPAGSYRVRAYTSWMQNFSPEYYFNTAVTVVNTRQASGAPKADSVAYDAQFFPEGGNLVQGLRSRVAFKVTDPAGHGVAATGQVLDNKGAVVATFATQQLGMGSFFLTPLDSQQPYTAVLKPSGSPARPVRRALPRAFGQGYVLRLDDTSPTQLTLTVNATGQQPETLYLLGHSRQKVALTARLALANGQATYAFDKSQLLEGISHLTLFTAGRQPVCERLYFRAPTRHLALAASADQPSYAARAPVSVQVAAPGQMGRSSVSMAVYQLDSLATTPPAAIEEYLWLVADLKGYIEAPGTYFAATEAARTAADNLMLTQGWSRWRWEDVLAGTAARFGHVPEPNGPIITGRITRAGTNAPAPWTMAYLASPSRTLRLSNSLSNADGRVRFELGPLPGPRELVVQTDPRQDSTSQITLLEPFSTSYAASALPGYGLLPRFAPEYARRHLQAQTQRVYLDRRRPALAPETGDTTSFFGKATETYYLDRYTRFKVMEEVLREYVPGVVVRIRKDGYHLMVDDLINKALLGNNPMVLLDGVPVFNMNKIMALNPLKVQKLEVMDSRYVHGAAIYDGLVSFTTYKGDLEGFQLDPHALVQQYEGTQAQREFFAPRYDTPEARQSRLPDLRNLLYWNPNIGLAGATPQTLRFYTGDQAGRYLVVLQGLAADGKAGSQQFTFDVKPAL